MNFREAQINDVSHLVELVNGAYRGENSKVGWTTEADLLGGIRADNEGIIELLTTPNSKIIVCDKNEQIQGCVNIAKKGKILYLGMLTVKPDLQNMGIGKGMLSYVESYAAKNDFDEIEMTVISKRSELIAWYERKGYRSTGERRPFPMNDPRFGIPKTELEFVVLSKKI